MKKISLLATAVLMTSLMSANAFAFHIGKPVVIPVSTQSATNQGIKSGQKQIYLMGIELTDKERANLLKFKNKLRAATPKLTRVNSQLASSVNLGMNGVPVLDQGKHGTCVTFATTAAVDAALGKGDYISQLCQLELAATLEKSSYLPSGWDGSSGSWVLEQMFRFGIVNKTDQEKQSCAGIKEYPRDNPDSEGNPMSAEDYKSLSTNLYDQDLYPAYLLASEYRYTEHFTVDQASENVAKVKEILSRGERVTFGAMLYKISNCTMGACAKYHANNDTWVTTKEFYAEDGVDAIGGHEMVIYGYDDNAIAIDNDGTQHQGLFFIRNSWGTDIGDQGEFYMSYDYFMMAVDEIQVVGHQTDS